MPPCRTRLRLQYASIKVLCIFASRKAVSPLNVVTEPTVWVAKCHRTYVFRRTVALAPTRWWCPCEVGRTAMRRERHCFLSLYSSGEENHLQPLGVCSLEPAWFSSSAAMLHLTCRQVLPTLWVRIGSLGLLSSRSRLWSARDFVVKRKCSGVQNTFVYSIRFIS